MVVLLSGQKLEAMVDPSITAQQMFESIITHIELPEFFFFGLTYISGEFMNKRLFKNDASRSSCPLEILELANQLRYLIQIDVQGCG